MRILRENWYRDVWLVIITACLIVFAFVWSNQNSDRITDSQRLSEQNASLIRQLQASRFEATRDNCLEINARNEKALGLIPPGKRQPLVVAFVDALAPPHKDCVAYAHERVSLPKRP
jgi:hypothetical protein